MLSSDFSSNKYLLSKKEKDQWDWEQPKSKEGYADTEIQALLAGSMYDLSGFFPQFTAANMQTCSSSY